MAPQASPQSSSGAAVQVSKEIRPTLVPEPEPLVVDHPAIDRPRVLHIEAVNPIRSVRKLVLEQGGFFVASAETLDDALCCLRELAFHALIIDEDLIGTGEMPAFRTLRTKCADAQLVVLCSTWGDSCLDGVISFDKGGNPADLLQLLHDCVAATG